MSVFLVIGLCMHKLHGVSFGDWWPALFLVPAFQTQLAYLVLAVGYLLTNCRQFLISRRHFLALSFWLNHDLTHFSRTVRSVIGPK